MEFIVNLASGFMNLFTLGGEQFMSWVTGIIPTIVMLLVLMNAIMAIAGEATVARVAKVCIGNPVMRYAVLPFVSAFMLGNPMALSIGKFLIAFGQVHSLYHCHINHHADRNAVGTNRDERVQTSGRLSYKIGLRWKHTTTHGRRSRRWLPELKTVYQSV